MKVSLLLFLSTLVATCHATWLSENPIHMLRPRFGAGGLPIHGINCQSWRLAVETNNLRNWKLVPAACEDYVGHYMLGKQYRDDCYTVVNAAIEYVEGLTLANDGKDIWIFDIDETTLSNMPYYARSDVLFGALPYNATAFDAWTAEGAAPAVPGALKLYNKLLSLGVKPVFLTGTEEKFRDIRIYNLKKVGYSNWENLILKGEADKGTSAVVYKSKKRTELVNSGYRIVGNIGDQWTDLLGENTGNRTFKLPDPMYYIS